MSRTLPFVDRLSRWPRSALWALFWGLIFLVGVADWLSGERYTVYILYFPIVALGSWLLGFRAAIALSFVSSILWIVDDIFSPPEPLPYLAKYWQAFTRFVVFVGFAYALARLRKAMSHEYRLSHFDELTGLSNRTSLFEVGQRDLARCRRAGRPLTAIFIDVDDFKRVNDNFGHAEGDRVLKAAAACIRQHTREEDLSARIGGDEFVILAAEMDFEAAAAFATRLRQRLGEAMSHRQWAVTFSIGVATFVRPPSAVDEVIKAADDLMYGVKRTAKNSIKHALLEYVEPEMTESLAESQLATLSLPVCAVE